MKMYLIKMGELELKGGNKWEFNKQLLANLVKLLEARGMNVSCMPFNVSPPINSGVLGADSGASAVNTDASGVDSGLAAVKIYRRDGRMYIVCEETHTDTVQDALAHLAGITWWAQASSCEKTMSAIFELCLHYAKKAIPSGRRTFKVETRRVDKSFPVISMDISRQAADFLLENIPGVYVSIHKPEFTIKVEIREKAYVYGYQRRGLRGLPVGSAGHGMLLLSGGIDSPVAGYLMAVRGMRLAAVYFHSYPYTSAESNEKVESLAKILSSYSMGIKLYSVNLLDIQNRIKERTPQPWRTVLLRMAMLRCAQRLALHENCRCLITGESLSQVASQTIENITCTQSVLLGAHEKALYMPVLRPLIGMDKEDIIFKARAIGTYETSILPYEDCCSLFAPVHPIIHGKTSQAQELYQQCELDPLIDESLAAMTRTRFYLGDPPEPEE
jgi:thiamine biosynthesis protein ThiI